jgi:hypothetical protein
VVDLVADTAKLKDTTKRRAYQAAVETRQVVRQTWTDFLAHATTTHEQFLNARDQAVQAGDEG